MIMKLKTQAKACGYRSCLSAGSAQQMSATFFLQQKAAS